MKRRTCNLHLIVDCPTTSNTSPKILNDQGGIAMPMLYVKELDMKYWFGDDKCPLIILPVDKRKPRTLVMCCYNLLNQS